MRRTHIAILAGAAALAAGTAYAETAKVPADTPTGTHRMQVALPDGSVANIEYVGNVAPKVTVVPGANRAAAAFADPFAQMADPFAGMDRMVAMMQARHDAMMRQMAALQDGAGDARGAVPGQLVVSSNMPAGAHFSMVQSTTDASGCTRTVSYSSDGSSEQPLRKEISSGKCDKADGAPAPAGAPASSPEPIRRAPANAV